MEDVDYSVWLIGNISLLGTCTQDWNSAVVCCLHLIAAEGLAIVNLGGKLAKGKQDS